MYGKFFSSTFTGSMFGAGADVFAVWGYVIANTVESHVELNPAMLASVLGTDAKRVEMAIEYLCSPDLKSRNPDHEGRRLLKQGPFQFLVVSHKNYRAMKNEEDRREYNRVKMRESRERRKNLSNDLSLTVNHSDSQLPMCAHTEAEAYTETEAKEQKPPARVKPSQFVVPPWIDSDVWAGFEEMRKKQRAPLTDRARRGIIKDLEKLCESGESADAVLQQSINNAYRGVFEIKRNGGGFTNGNGRENANITALRESLASLNGNGHGSGSEDGLFDAFRIREKAGKGTV